VPRFRSARSRGEHDRLGVAKDCKVRCSRIRNG
jgi:hypothetical protein